jgi:uroporphyrin-3 C-methyltransferase
MSEETEKEGVVIDVTPEPEATPEEAAAPEAPEQTEKPAGQSKAPLIIAVIALLLVAGALVAAFQYTQQTAQDLAVINNSLSKSLAAQETLEQQLAAANTAVKEQAELLAQQQSRFDEQQQSLDEAKERFDQQEQLLDSERLKMQQREAELRASVADVHRRVGSSGTQWLVAEAEYLMRVANERLNLARDTGTAHKALVLADERLRDTKDPGWIPVRNQLAHDIAALDAAELPDTAGIAARLDALAEQVPQLQLSNATLGGSERTPQGETEATPRQERNWDTLLDDLWAGFKDTVRIRRRDKPVAAMLAPEQQFFLYENLRLYLESARLAVARADRELYRDSLNTVGSWLSTHFDNADPLTKSTRSAVTELMRIDIRPMLPDISASLRSLQVRQKLQADLAGSPPALAKEAKEGQEREE